MSARRSVRTYADRDIADADLDAILKAGRLGPSGKGIYPYDFIVIRDPETIQKLVGCRKGGAKMLTTAKAAIAVLGDENRSDTWIEDDAVAMTQMHLMASYLGLGSCWIHRGREQFETEYGRSLLVKAGIDPDRYEGVDSLVIGWPAATPTVPARKPNRLFSL